MCECKYPTRKEYKAKLKEDLKSYAYPRIITKILPSALKKDEKMLLIGGFVRDILLYNIVTDCEKDGYKKYGYIKYTIANVKRDFDIMIVSNADEEKVCERINDRLQQYMFETNKEYITKVVYINNKHTKLVKVYTHNENDSYDISVYNEYKGRSLKERVIRNLNTRDFDFNAVAYNITDNKLYIRNKYMFEDLQNKILNSDVLDYYSPTCNSFRNIIQEDPIRVIRGLRFAATYNMLFHSSRVIDMHMTIPRFYKDKYTNDRLVNEICKLFDSNRLDIMMFYDFLIGQFISPLFEEFKVCYPTPEIADVDESVENKITKYYAKISEYYPEFLNLTKRDIQPCYTDIWITLLAGLLRRLYEKPKKKNMDKQIISFLTLELLRKDSIFHINNLGKQIIEILINKMEMHKLEMMAKYKDK